MTADPIRHLRVRLDAANALLVLTDAEPIPFAAWAESSSLGSIRILDLDIVPLDSPTSGPACTCGRPRASDTPPRVLEPLGDLDLDMVRRWTPHSCAVPSARRVVSLDCTGVSAGGEGEEFRLGPVVIPAASSEEGVLKEGCVAIYNGLWEYDEFPRFVVDGTLPPRVVLRVMAPGDEDELDESGTDDDDSHPLPGEESVDEEVGEEEGEGESEDAGEWEDEDEAEQLDEPLSEAEKKIRDLMARTKYLPLTAFILAAQADRRTHFTLVDVESWDEDADDVEGGIRGELAKAMARNATSNDVEEIVSFVSLGEYRQSVSKETFRLESENEPSWA